MAGPHFDAHQAVRFDLKGGSAADARGNRVLLVPSAALATLEETSPDVVITIGEEIGRACGARIASRLGGEAGVRAAQLEVVVSHLAGELAVAGVGAVHLERWGRAMVCVVGNASLASERFLEAVIASALGAAANRSITAASLGRDGDHVRFFLGSAATAGRVRELVSNGKSHGEIVADLQGAAS
jgi:hypothetical protein